MKALKCLTHEDRRRARSGCSSLRCCWWRWCPMLSWTSQHTLVESDRGRRGDLDTSLNKITWDLIKSLRATEASFTWLTWSDSVRCGDLETSLRTTLSASTRAICFMLGGVGSKPQNGSCNQPKVSLYKINAIFKINTILILIQSTWNSFDFSSISASADNIISSMQSATQVNSAWPSLRGQIK